MISKPILAFLPHGDLYADYWWAIPWHIAILGISSLFGFYSTAEIAANRFGFLKWSIPLDLSYCALLLVVTDHNYFSSLIPSALTEFLTAHNVRSLNTMLWWMTAIAIIRAIVCLMAIATKKVSRTSRPEQHQP